jgi:spore germination protein GerM
MKCYFTILLIVLLLIFPQRVYCSELSSTEYDIHRIFFDENGENHWFLERITVCGNDVLVVAEEVLNTLFKDSCVNTYSYPEGTVILNASLLEGHITVDISPEIRAYGGGYTENILVNQIIRTLFGLPGVSKITLLVDGRTGGFPEGTVVDGVESYEYIAR